MKSHLPSIFLVFFVNGCDVYLIPKVNFLLGMAIVIVGAGIIGTCTAYYLSELLEDPSSVHLVEICPELFESASGYAGGFLARDWFSPALSELGELSFRLHKTLATAHNGHRRWGYSRSISVSLDEDLDRHSKADWLIEGASRATATSETVRSAGHHPSWLTARGTSDVMSNGDTTAQV